MHTLLLIPRLCGGGTLVQGQRAGMISTVTTSTVSSITSAALFGTLGGISIIVLVTLLIQKELVSVADETRLLRLQRALNIAIWPLIVVFILMVFVKVNEILTAA
jgi:hypothetical protein